MILAVVGPTGVGKTKLSIALAKKYNAIIINCDAMQVYQDMNIGTAKVTEEEKEGISHYLLDFVPVTKNYTVYDYQKDAREIMALHQNQNIIFVGGTGLYLKAALYQYQFEEEKNPIDYSKYSNDELYQMCLKKDANCSIHSNNRRRLERFLQKENTPSDARLLYPAIILGLTMEREKLYERINNRVDKMIEEGLLEEVKSFYDQNIHSKALETAIGYKELYAYFDNQFTLEEAIEKVKQNSRKYAKRQFTFFRHQLPVHWITVEQDFDKTIEEAIKIIENEKKQ